MAYLVVLTIDAPLVKILYYYISVGCSLYIAYMELFERLIRQQDSVTEVESDEGDVASAKSSQQSPLCERVVHYMTSTNAYRNPDLSMTMLASALYTNRTTLSLALRELGYPSFNAYINTLRIEDFLQRMRDNASVNYQDAFYDAGFRSRATALRNFKQYTGKTPSAYFMD